MRRGDDRVAPMPVLNVLVIAQDVAIAIVDHVPSVVVNILRPLRVAPVFQVSISGGFRCPPRFWTDQHPPVGPACVRLNGGGKNLAEAVRKLAQR
jgi:hypothetical protein